LASGLLKYPDILLFSAESLVQLKFGGVAKQENYRSSYLFQFLKEFNIKESNVFHISK